MLECIIDSREQTLYEDTQQQLTIPIRTQMLTLGDVIIQTTDGEILLLIERKSVRDLVQSLKDGRYHDQRRRWDDFIVGSPNSSVSLWLEGDLLSAGMDDTMRSSLLNALFRLQSKHHVIVHQVRTREAFVKSLQIVVQKFEKEPYHLVKKPEGNTIVDMGRFKKSSNTEGQYWTNCLALIPGVSLQTAIKITNTFPSMPSFLISLDKDPTPIRDQLATLPLNEKRRLGGKQADRIIRHIHPLCLDQKTKEEKINIS